MESSGSSAKSEVEPYEPYLKSFLPAHGRENRSMSVNTIGSKSVKDMSISDCLAFLKEGIVLYKCEKGEIKSPVKNFIDYHECNFVCKRNRMSAISNLRWYKKIHIYKIDEVRPGFNTLVHQRNLKEGLVDPKDEDRALAFIFAGRRKTLNFLACNKRERDICVRGFNYLIEKFHAPSHLKEEDNYKDSFDRWIRHCFITADKNEDGKLTFNEILGLLQQMHSNFHPDTTFLYFKQADSQKDNYLTEDEFFDFYHKIIYRKELKDLMQLWNDGNEENTLTANQLQRFMKEEQSSDLSLQDCEELIQKFEVSDDFSKNGILSLEGFRFLLLSKNFDILDRFKAMNVYEDMDKPLTDYFISTSHNTYLLKGQLVGNICTEAYIRALSKGCRCLELDVQDGLDGEPVIFHKKTLTEINAILFSDALKAIEENAFKVSRYPLLLNIENHCSLSQQNRMAYWILQYFSDKLADVKLFESAEKLPSPNVLKNKVLIRARTESKSSSGEIARNFSRLVHIKTTSFDDIETTASFKAFESISLNESKAEDLIEERPVDFAALSRKFLVRTYPSGYRANSKNYPPEDFWSFGCQLVALNFQSPDSSMSVYEGFFADNGRCGYVLKPEILRCLNNFNPSNCPRNVSVILKIRIISGQQLKPILKRKKYQKDVFDPVVKITTHGLSCDRFDASTEPVFDNAWNPFWNSEFEFFISYPELCVIRFSVWDYDMTSSNDLSGSRAIPITMLNTGYRHIGLLDSYGKPIPFATLFVHIGIEEGPNDNKSSEKYDTIRHLACT